MLYINSAMMHIQPQGMTTDEFIDAALKEDIGAGDYTSLACIKEDATGKAIIKMKEDGIIAGLDVAVKVFDRVDTTLKVDLLTKEGAAVKKGETVLNLEGSVRSMLTAERLALNILQRMSGIATMTRAYVDRLHGLKTKVLDTRKTTPNFRMFEKQAVKMGGGENHRYGLYDMILIKNNHVDACGGIANAIYAANEYLLKNKLYIPVEVETRTIEEVNEVIEVIGVTKVIKGESAIPITLSPTINRIMFDNFQPDVLKKAVKLINGRFETEASGNITLDNVRAYAETGVDYVSVGALTHSYRSLDISMKITGLSP